MGDVMGDVMGDIIRRLPRAVGVLAPTTTRPGRRARHVRGILRVTCSGVGETPNRR